MENPIKFKTRLTKADFLKTTRGFIVSQFSNQVFGVLLILLDLAGVLGLIRNGIEPTILTFVIFATFGLVYSYFIAPAVASSAISQDSEWSSEFDWSVSQREIIINSRAAGAKTGWDMFQDFVETREYYLLIHSENKKLFSVIPKRAFKSTDSEKEFRRLLAKKYEFRRKSFIVRNWRVILFILIILSINVYAFYILSKNR